tara:strand:- start:561 stop:734 length:174 start_codon:yes stop_codon:yes gene_type:complete
MKPQPNDKVKATWADGYSIVGRFVGEIRGYYVIIDENGKEVACNKTTVEFEVLDEAG